MTQDGHVGERKMAFFVWLGVSAVGALLVAGAGYVLLNSMISAQERRNEQLRAEIKVVNRQIEEINDLETQKQRFIKANEMDDAKNAYAHARESYQKILAECAVD